MNPACRDMAPVGNASSAWKSEREQRTPRTTGRGEESE